MNDERCNDCVEETTPDDFVEEYLTKLFKEETACSSSSKNSSNDSIMADILKLETRPKVPIVGSGADNFDISCYWKQRKISNPRLFRIAQALMSIPSKQVTVESQLKFVLTDSRTRLSNKMIKDIMLLKINKSLWPEVIKILESEI